MSPRGRRTLSAGNRPGKRASLPGLWFLTGEERGPDALAAAGRLPRGAGVILRGYRIPERALLARRLARLCRRRGLALLVAGDPALARSVGAHGVHIPRWAPPRRQGARIASLSVHGARDIRRALRARADLLVVSPVFATGSHPGAAPLGPVRFGLLARGLPAPAAALGGIAEAGARRLRGLPVAALCATGFGERGMRLPPGSGRPGGRGGAISPIQSS